MRPRKRQLSWSLDFSHSQCYSSERKKESTENCPNRSCPAPTLPNIAASHMLFNTENVAYSNGELSYFTESRPSGIEGSI